MAKLITVYAVHSGDTDRSQGTPRWFFSTYEKAHNHAEGRGWWGGKATVTEQTLLKTEEGEYYHINKTKPVNLNPYIDDKVSKRQAALNKLTKEEQRLLGVR